MKSVLLPFLICFAISISAQTAITITSADMPVLNDTFRYSVASNIVTLDPTPAGTSHTWDFSMLAAASQYVDTFRSPSGINFLFSAVFSGADLAKKFSFTQSLGSLQVTDIYNFFNKKTTAFESMGFGAFISGLPVPVVYTSPDVLYKFPMNYGNRDTSHTDFTVTIPTVGSIYRTQTRINHVDGWGTLIIPSGTHQVLRVRSEVESKDSATGLPFPIFTTTVEYKWISKSSKVPLLEIVEVNGIVTSATFRDNNIVSGIEDALITGKTAIYPNPASGDLFFRNPVGNNEKVDIEIYDITGKLCYITSGSGTDATGILRITPALENGTYLVRVLSRGDVLAVKKILWLKE